MPPVVTNTIESALRADVSGFDDAVNTTDPSAIPDVADAVIHDGNPDNDHDVFDDT